VNTLIPQMAEFLREVEPAPGVPPTAVTDVLLALATSAIQQDPTQATITPDVIDPAIIAAIQAAVVQVAVLKKTFTRVRVVQERLPIGNTAASAAEEVSEIFGPFVRRSGDLVRYANFRSAAFLGVTRLVPPNTVEDQIVIPAASTSDADFRNWTLAPGTVWINSRFLVAGATGFTGLRIAGGTMQLAAGTFRFDSGIVIPAGSDWSLSVEPEAAPPAGAGSDGDALALTLPTRLDVSSNGAPTVAGAAVLSGFGSDLHFTFSGSPALEGQVVDGQQIAFPMVVAEPSLSINGNASNVVKFSGEASVTSARWTLPISQTPLVSLANAAHGGSIVIHLDRGIDATLTGQHGGPFQLFFRSLTANAQRIEINAVQTHSGASYVFDFWNTSSASMHFAHGASPTFFFRSERGAIDTIAVSGASISNKWDLPCGADGQPFPFDGGIDLFGILSSPAGASMILTASAGIPDPDPLHGVVLENLYLTVKGPRTLFVLAPFDALPLLASGIAILQFDVNFAVPTLPDPYAANLPLPDRPEIFSNALGIRLSWQNAATPTLRAYLQQQVHFPEPRFDDVTDNDDRELLEKFHTFLGAQPEFLCLLDMSSCEHLLGVAFESPSDNPAVLLDNRLAFEMQHVRLLLPPQVLWEPIRVESNPLVPVLHDEIIRFNSQGGPTLIGANSVTLVPTLPEPVTAGILDGVRLNQNTAALFSLPFGLRVLTTLASSAAVFDPIILKGPKTELHEPIFDKLSAARQMRLTAANNVVPNSPGGPVDLSRTLPGVMRLLQNLVPGNLSGLTSVLPSGLEQPLNDQFAGSVPLQQADLSGYGLSTFSHWISGDDGGDGFIKAEFQVLNGRTAYEVLQFRSVLYECQARVVRTVIMERRSSGRVFRTDTGWVAVDAGDFFKPILFVKGAVRSLQNIRRIRVTGPPIPVEGAAVEPVIFDADADIDGHTGGLVPIYDRPGYVQVQAAPEAPPNPKIPPPKPLTPLTNVQLKALYDLVGPIGSPIDCVTRLGKTLEMQLSSIVSDVALDDPGKTIGFAVAVVGSPKLPRAGQWSVMRIDPVTHEVSPVDPRRGVPVVQVGVAYRFREPSDTLRTPHIQHGLLMCNESSRVLFPQPFVSLVAPFGTMQFDLPPVIADPYSLVQSTGHFPRQGFALGLKEKALFHIADDNTWRIDAPEFNVDTTPSAGLLTGADWGISRGYLLVPPVLPPPAPGDPPPVIPPTTVKLAIDSAAAVALNIAVPRSNLNLDLPSPLDSILKIHTNYESVVGGLPKLGKPTLEFSGALQELTDILNSLSQLLNLPFEFQVTVTSDGGASPSFTVHMHLDFRIGKSPEERVDVGMGKFYGEFTVEGELEASLTGVNRALLSLEFQGDMQQGILPPLLYAGGLFRFSIELHDKGSPTIEMGLGIVFSIGGELIPGLIEVEATVHYGYTLIPEDLSPGAFIGMDAHAKLLGGLIGFSFGVEAMAKMKRKEQGIVTIWAQIRVAASVQIAFFVDEDIDFTTQFQQDIPLAALSLIPGVGILPAAASVL
jgi:hypothetical protein